MASIRPYKSKQWRAVVRRTGYKVQSAIFDLKDDAVTWARDIEGRMDKRTFVDASRHDEETVASLFEKFRDEVCPKRLGAVWEQRRIEFFLADCEWMKRRIPQLLPEDIRDWRNTRLETVAAATVNRDLNFFTTGYNYLIQLIPALFVAPLFIHGTADFGVISQAAMAFTTLVAAFSLIVSQFQAISAYASVTTRLSEFMDTIEMADSLNAASCIGCRNSDIPSTAAA